jgi:hypothetical protein
MRRFDLFGARIGGLSTIGTVVGNAAGLEFHLHESGYLGGEYFRGTGEGAVEVLIQTNFEDDEGYLVEPEFSAFPTLIYVNDSNDDVADAIASIDDDIVALRSETVE